MRIQPGLSSRLLLSTACVLLLIFSAPATLVRAQTETTGALRGRVLDADTKLPIAKATVQIIYQLSEVPVARQTGTDGVFYVGLLTPGRYLIRALAPGYKTHEQVQILLATQTNTILEIPPIALVKETAATTTTTTTTTTTQATATPTPTQTTAEQIAEAEADVAVNINTTDGRRNGAFTEKEVSTLPLGATTLTRTFDELALLLPGVALPPQTLGSVAGPGVGPGVGSAGQFSVNGLRSRANNFTVDGSDNNDEDIGVRRQGFFALVPQPIESIQEYQVITLLAPAQYGRNLGAQVNAVSKRGGNETHGTVFGFINSSQLNARNFFDYVGSSAAQNLRSGNQLVLNCTRPNALGLACQNAAGQPINGATNFTVRNGAGDEDSFTLGQGGFVMGGPLKPNQLFYFISAEGELLNANKEESFAVPTVRQRGLFNTGASGLFFTPFEDINGIFPIGSPNIFFPTALGGDAIFSLFPFPNNPGGVYGQNTYTQQLPASAQGKILSGKFDAVGKWRGREQSFTARYNFTDDWRDIPVTGGALFSTLRPRVRTQNFSTFWNSEITSPESRHPIFNQLRASYGRTRLDFDESRDQTFLLPSNMGFTNPDDERFLLNAPFFSNFTLPDDFGVPSSGAVEFVRFGTGAVGTQAFLGPVGQVSIAGFSPVGVDVFNFPQRRVNNTYQLADTMTWAVRSNHSLTFGVDVRRTELISDLPRNSRPLITFNGTPRLRFDVDPMTGDFINFRFGNFINGIDLAASEAPTGFYQSLQLPGTSSYLNLRYYQYNFFAQDEWRVRPNFSLTFGLRYEYNTPPTSANDQLERAFTEPRLQLIQPLQTFLEGRTQVFDPDKNNFAPRVGFAWSPDWFGPQRTTVIRGGYGLFYDQIIGSVVSQSRNVFPNVITANFAGGFGAGGGFFPFDLVNPSNPALSLVRGRTLNQLDLSAFTLQQQLQFLNFIGGNVSGITFTLPDRQLKTPMAHHYSITFEQQFSRSLVFSAAYVGTQGRNLLRVTTPNLGPNALLVPLLTDALDFEPRILGVTLAPGSRVSNAGNVSGGRPVNNIGSVTIFNADAESRYDALQLQMRGRLPGLFGSTSQFQAGYTFSKVEDDVSDVFDLAGAPALPQNSLTFVGERAAANFDVRHRFSYNYITDLSNWGRSNGFLRFLFHGTEIAGTGVFQTGQPFTVNSIYDVNLDGNLTDRPNTLSGIEVTGDRRRPVRLTVNDPTTLLAPIGTDGSVPRNAFRAGNLFLTNAALIKNFSLSESQKLTFRMEVFNLWNRANFGVPVRFLETPWFGQATSTITPARRIQFALKYQF